MDVLNREQAQHYTWGDGGEAWTRFMSPELSVIEETVPPGGGEAAHYHRKARQVFFVMDGEVDFTVGKKTRRIGPGDSVVVPPTTIHSLVNPGDVPAHLLVVSSPESHADRIDVDRD